MAPQAANDRDDERLRVPQAVQRAPEPRLPDEEQVIIEKNGIPVAAIVPISVVRGAELTERRRADLRAAFEAARAELRGIPPEAIEREIRRAVAEVEEERRLRRSDPDAAASR